VEKDIAEIRNPEVVATNRPEEDKIRRAEVADIITLKVDLMVAERPVVRQEELLGFIGQKEA